MSRKRTNNYKKFKERINNNNQKIEYLNIKSTGLQVMLQANEKFKLHPYHKNYWISNYGQVIKQKKDGRFIQLSITVDDKAGREKVYLRTTVDNKAEYVHRLVAET